MIVERISAVAIWLVAALILLIVANVFMRYGFRRGLVSLQELEWHLLAPVVMFGISFALCRGALVRVDVLYDRFSEHTRAVLDLFAALALVVIFLFLFKISIPFTMQSWVTGERSPNPAGLPHRFLLKAVIPVGLILMVVQSIALALRATGQVIDPAMSAERQGSSQQGDDVRSPEAPGQS